MMNAIVKKMYRVFDELHAERTNAEAVLSGWEHKEKVTEHYVVGYEEQLNAPVVYDLNGLYLAKTLADALEEVEYMS